VKRIATVLMVVAAAGCSKKQPVVNVPPTPAPQLQTPPAPRRTTHAPPRTTERTRTEREPPAAPQRTLEPLASPEDRAAHVKRIETSIKTAEQNLSTLQMRQPATRKEDLAHVQSLIRQARAAQTANDLPSAQSFAQRAEILSADLMAR
jgi:hypothetical protein